MTAPAARDFLVTPEPPRPVMDCNHRTGRLAVRGLLNGWTLSKIGSTVLLEIAPGATGASARSWRRGQAER